MTSEDVIPYHIYLLIEQSGWKHYPIFCVPNQKTTGSLGLWFI